MKLAISNQIPAYPKFAEGVRRSPDRGFKLSAQQTNVALKNALRYIPENLHAQLAPEFLEELRTRGKIYDCNGKILASNEISSSAKNLIVLFFDISFLYSALALYFDINTGVDEKQLGNNMFFRFLINFFIFLFLGKFLILCCSC